MAKAKNEETSKRVKRSFGSKLKWVMDYLSDDELEHIDEIAPDAEGLFQFIMDAVDSGIDIKLSWDAYSACYQTVAIGGWDDFPSAGYATSGRSSGDSRDALLIIWYKVAVKAQGDLSSVASLKQADRIRG